MHFIIIKGQNSFRSDLERTKRRERRRNRKKQNAHWHILIRDGEMVRSKWYHNIHISVYIFFVYFTAYLVHTRRVIKYLRQMRANREVWAPEYKKKLTHTRTSERKRVWCNQKSKVFETRSRILYKHVSFIQKSRRDIKVGDATMRTEYTHIHFHKERT